MTETVKAGGLVIHRDGSVKCHECHEAVQYTELAHLDWYADVQFAQCKACAAKNGAYCAVTEIRMPA